MQPRPEGLAQAFLIAEDFLAGDQAALILGDNLFYGPSLGRKLAQLTDQRGAHVFAYEVANPSEYGVVEFDESGLVLSVEEKPARAAQQLRDPRPVLLRRDRRRRREVDHAVSARGELEITVGQRPLPEVGVAAR